VLIAAAYWAFYSDRAVQSLDREEQLAYHAIAATDGLQAWRIGATKALDPDAEVRLVYTSDQVCRGEGTPKKIASAEVRPVTYLAKGGFMRPGQLLLSADDTTLMKLCGELIADRHVFWSTDSKELKLDLELLGQVPAYYAARQ
jgi:hypothetical protein